MLVSPLEGHTTCNILVSVMLKSFVLEQMEDENQVVTRWPGSPGPQKWYVCMVPVCFNVNVMLELVEF